MSTEIDGIQTEFSSRMSYGDYLQLDTLLSAQAPLTSEHDELLFIVIHQVMELWLKLLNRELDTAFEHVRADQLPPAFKCTARINRIQEQLIQAWTVLSTMTRLIISASGPPSEAPPGSNRGSIGWWCSSWEQKTRTRSSPTGIGTTLRISLRPPIGRQASMMRRCACSHGGATPFHLKCSIATSRARMRPTPGSRQRGRRSIGNHKTISIFTNWPRNLSTSRMPSSNGASGT